MAALGGVEGRDANEAVDAGFTGEQTESEFASDGEGGGLDAGFVTILNFVDAKKCWLQFCANFSFSAPAREIVNHSSGPVQ